jgi:WD40 repeat protein
MVLDVAIHGPWLLAATQSGQVNVFDWQRGERLESLLALEAAEGQAFAPTIRSVAISPSGSVCAVASSDGRLRLFDLDGAAEASPRFTLHPGDVTVARFVDEERLLLGDMRGEIALLDLASRSERFRVQLEYDPVYAIALGPDGSRAAIGFRSSRIRLVDPENGRTLRTLERHRDGVFSLAWLDGSRLVSGSKDKTAILWELETRGTATPRVLYEGDHYVTAVTVDREQERVALTVEEGGVALVRVADSHVSRVLQCHTAPVQYLAFVDHGRRLVSAGHDARIVIWDLAPEREEGP